MKRLLGWSRRGKTLPHPPTHKNEARSKLPLIGYRHGVPVNECAIGIVHETGNKRGGRRTNTLNCFLRHSHAQDLDRLTEKLLRGPIGDTLPEAAHVFEFVRDRVNDIRKRLCHSLSGKRYTHRFVRSKISIRVADCSRVRIKEHIQQISVVTDIEEIDDQANRGVLLSSGD